MSAPTPAPGDESPREGFYPDPSIPGYVRYWNGASWVPGTSRPAPEQAGPLPAPSPGRAAGPPHAAAEPAPAPMEETGPVFLDEEASGGERPEPSSAWQADAFRQTGFGGDRDRRVSWGGGTGQPGEQPETQPPGEEGPVGDPSAGVPAALPPAAPPADRAPADPRAAASAPSAPDPPRGALPGMREPGDRLPAVREPDARAPEDAVARRDRTRGPAAGDADGPPTDGTVTMRALDRGGRTPVQPPAEGTMTIRALGPGASARNPGPVPGGAPEPAARPAGGPVPAEPHSPLTAGPDGGAASWAQQAPPPARPDQAYGEQAYGPRSQKPQQPRGPQQVARQLPPPERGQGLPPQVHPQRGQQYQQPPQPHAPAPQQLTPQQHHQPQQSLGEAVQAGRPGPAAQADRLGQVGAQRSAPDQPVIPWKPPVDDPFQRLARAQASARPAGLGKRLLARVVDTIVLGALVGALGFPLITRAMDHIDEKIDAAKLSGETVEVWLVDSTTAGLFGAVLGAFLVLGVLLEVLPTARWGRTLGKKLCGLDVRDIESHTSPTFGAALRRWLVYGVLGILVIGVIDVLWCLVDRPWRQCWHDKAAHTFVAG